MEDNRQLLENCYNRPAWTKQREDALTKMRRYGPNLKGWSEEELEEYASQDSFSAIYVEAFRRGYLDDVVYDKLPRRRKNTH